MERWQAFAKARRAMAVAALWGFAEATFFFVVPDLWIGLLALFSWRASPRAVASALGGALIGGALLYAAGAQLAPERSAHLLDAVPAISPAMIARVEAEMGTHGPSSMLFGPLQGTPYKIYARTAGAQRESFLAFLLWTIPARGARFLLVAAFAALYGALARRLTARPVWVVAPYLLAWAVFYAWYFRTFGA